MVDYAQKQRKALLKINEYGATLSRTIIAEPTYVDEVTGEVVAEPVPDYNNNLINPVTYNTVTRTSGSTTETFKGLEVTNEVIYGDFSSNADYLGSLIEENTRVYMISSTVADINLGDKITTADGEYTVIRNDPFSPGDIPIYQNVWIKK